MKQDVCAVIEKTEVEKIIGDQLRPFLETANLIEEDRRLFTNALRVVERRGRRAKAIQFATSLCDGMSGGFIALSLVHFVQGNYAFGLGFLGPAVAAVAGAIGFRRL